MFVGAVALLVSHQKEISNLLFISFSVCVPFVVAGKKNFSFKGLSSGFASSGDQTEY